MPSLKTNKQTNKQTDRHPLQPPNDAARYLPCPFSQRSAVPTLFYARHSFIKLPLDSLRVHIYGLAVLPAMKSAPLPTEWAPHPVSRRLREEGSPSLPPYFPARTLDTAPTAMSGIICAHKHTEWTVLLQQVERTVQLGVGRAYSSVGSGPCVQFSWQWAVRTVQLAVGRAYSSVNSGPCVQFSWQRAVRTVQLAAGRAYSSDISGPCVHFS
jgi:hypothetical protein